MSGKQGNTNASKRRQLAVEASRLKIKASKSIDALYEIEKELRVAEADVPRCRARADIHFGLLRKVVPDLRAIEHSGHVSQTVEHIGVQETDRRIGELLGDGKVEHPAPSLPH